MADPTLPDTIGQSAPRVEDLPLLTGQGRFVSDLRLPDMLHAAFVRSPHAHARITGIDTAAAAALPGVHAVYTYADLRPLMTCDRIPMAMPGAAIRFHAEPEVLTSAEVCHVGEAVAMVVADDRYIAEDAADLVEVDYDPLPAVSDPRDGLAADAPLTRLGTETNIVAAQSVAYGEVEAAFNAAAHVFRETFDLHKGGGHSIEGRGVVTQYDAGAYTLWDATQMPNRAQTILCDVLGLNEHQVRVIAPDVGGGFGPKFIFYPEEVAVPLAARLLGRPVKWIEDRTEHFLACTQERDQYWDIEVATDSDGRLQGIRGSLVHDHGAYTPYGMAVPVNSATNLLGPYELPTYRLDISIVLTNRVPATPTRGAGRPQGTFVMERLMDRIARELDLARDEVRRRNMIPAAAMPYVTGVTTRDGGAMTYDSGDYPECQRRALEAADWAGFPARQAAAKAEGRYLGIGFANFVEGTGRGPFELATLRLGPNGRLMIATGATAQGQGTATTLGQIAAGILGLDPGDIDVIPGDTLHAPMGFGAFGSRQTVNAGSAVHDAAHELRDKLLAAGEQMLEAAPDDLELADGAVRLKAAPEKAVPFADIARGLRGQPGYAIPPALTPGLEATVNWKTPAMTYCNGAHVAELEVDPLTGGVSLYRYVVVHDCGRMVNPRIVEGQVHGGAAHGIGQALYEWMRFDADGQPLTVQYSDYLLPSATTVPEIEVHHMESPTPLNPLGAKGAGEGGTIPAAAAIASALDDALADFGVRVNQLPMTPARLRAAIEQA